MSAVPGALGERQKARARPALLFGMALALTVASAARAAEPVNWLDAPRQLRAQTRLALEAEDWEAAWRLNAAGRALQPGHTGLIKQAIGIADEAGDGARVLSALEALAVAGSSMDVDKLRTISRLPPGELARLRRRFAANQAPVGSARTAAEVPLPDALIESVAVDPKTNELYLGSVAARAIYRVRPGKPNVAEVFADREDGLYSVFGMVVDPEASLLYAATGTVPQTPLDEGEEGGTAVMAFDLETGERRGRYEFAGAGRIADLALVDGTLYVADTGAPHVYRLAPDGKLEKFASDPRFVSLQGIAPLGDALIVADYAVGLWRLDRETGRATMVRTPADSQSLIGLDGLAAGPGASIHAVRNGVPPQAVLRLTFSRDGGLTEVRTVLRGHPSFDEPTLLSISGGTAYLVANSQWPLFPADGSAPSRPRADPVILTWPVRQAQVPPATR